MRLQAIQKQWRARVLAPLTTPPNTSTPPNNTNKQYILAQFPYPSGSLHMGHARVYTMADTLARCAKLRGFQVLSPMGWDAFGLPAENAARDRQIDPATWTDGNVEQMRVQMDNLGLAFDHGGGVMTSRVEYYKWTQWLFERLHKAGLAYKKEAPVNWDPVDQTVLADEQVDNLGRSWRSGAAVERRLLSQWFLRITAYADRLVDDLDQLAGWPESVKEMQREWIGRQIGFVDHVFGSSDHGFEVFLTRPHEHVASVSVPTGHPLASYSFVRFQNNSNVAVPVVVSASGKDIQLNYHQQTANTPNLQQLGYKVEKRYRLRDWLISRQRKWGCPIPTHTCPEHGVRLNTDPICQTCTDTVPEPDTMDTFVDSSWYFLRFCDPKNAQMIFDPQTVKTWMPVDVYIGGVEHAVLHLLYARFMHKFVVDDLRLECGGEPFTRLICQGLVMGRTFKCPDTLRYLKPHEYTAVPTSGTQVAVLPDGRPAVVAFEKMSKSKYNGVDPDSLVKEYSADAVRLNILFKAPPEFSLYWDERDLVGQQRWLLRLVKMFEAYAGIGTASLDKTIDGLVTQADQQILTALNETITQVTKQLTPESPQFNTAIAALMKFTNKLHDFRERHRSAAYQTCLGDLAIMLYPMAPHTAMHLYHLLHPDKEISTVTWPTVVETPEGCKKTATISVQVDGKTMMRVQCAIDSLQEHVEQVVMSSLFDDDGNRGVVPRQPTRIVFIPNRVINYCT